jgi:hypothetical protein
MSSSIAQAPLGSRPVTLWPPSLRLPLMGLAVGVMSLIALLIVCLSTAPGQFFDSWLYAWTFWIGLTLGCEVILMINYNTGGTWGVPIRRLLEAGSITMLPMIVLFIPVLIGLHELYPWMDPARLAADDKLHHKTMYLNAWFFIVRTVIYFAIWTGMAWLLNRWSLEQDERADVVLAGRLQRLSAGGLPIYAITSTFAAFDWVMSLDAHFYSTIWGMIFWLMQTLSAMSFIIVLYAWMSRRPPMDLTVTAERFFEQGQLMTVMIMAAAYCEFSQFVIYWHGNLPDEISFYVPRMVGGWGVLAMIVLFVGLFFPFFSMLFGHMKRDPVRLGAVAAVVFVGEMFHLYWVVVPWMPWAGYWMQGTYLLAMLSVGGLWMAFFFWWLGRRPLLIAVDAASVDLRDTPPQRVAGPSVPAPPEVPLP